MEVKEHVLLAWHKLDLVGREHNYKAPSILDAQEGARVFVLKEGDKVLDVSDGDLSAFSKHARDIVVPPV